MLEPVITDHAPQAVGPYSQGIIHHPFVFVSGQLPIDTNGNMPELMKDKTLQCLRNIEAILKEAGGTRNSIAKLTVFLTDLTQFNEVNEAFKVFFENLTYPARSTIEVSALPKNAPIEIEAIGVVS